MARKRMRRLVAAGAAVVVSVIASAQPALAPPLTGAPFCARDPRAWSDVCASAIIEAQDQLSRAAATAGSPRWLLERGWRLEEGAERAALDAAHACAGAERFEDAQAMAELAAQIAASRARRTGAAPRPVITPPQRCLDQSPARAREARAFNAYLRAARVEAVRAALRPTCLMDGPDIETSPARHAADMRCAWLASAGAERAERGLRAFAGGHDDEALEALTAGLDAMEAAREACRGRAGADAALVRQALMQALTGARGEPRVGSSESAEIRGALLEEGGRSLAELLRLEEPRENDRFFCHPRPHALEIAGE